MSDAELNATIELADELKDPKYKDAWRKRGELVGIFCNIARKYDRLVVAQGEADPDKTEARADTAADLCVYAVKYVTWLVEHDPDAAEAIAGATDSSVWNSTTRSTPSRISSCAFLSATLGW